MKTLLMALLIIGCTQNPVEPVLADEPIETKSATFTITDIKQTYYSSLEEYGMVTVYYTVRNTGNVDIDYYKVYIKATCEDGSSYTSWDNGLDISVGQEVSDFTYINTADKKYTAVTIGKYELTSY